MCVIRAGDGSEGSHGDETYKRDFKELEIRRRRGMRMLARGVSQAEVGVRAM